LLEDTRQEALRLKDRNASWQECFWC
jgi:hypothetical protein